MVQLKELYLAKNLSELRKVCDVKIENAKPQQIINTLGRLVIEAERASDLQNDEELAYCYYMRYFGLFDVLKKHPECKDKVGKIIQMMGGVAVLNELMDKLEALNDSLDRRYKFRDLRGFVSKIEADQNETDEMKVKSGENEKPERIKELEAKNMELTQANEKKRNLILNLSKELVEVRQKLKKYEALAESNDSILGEILKRYEDKA